MVKVKVITHKDKKTWQCNIGLIGMASFYHNRNNTNGRGGRGRGGHKGRGMLNNIYIPLIYFFEYIN